MFQKGIDAITKALDIKSDDISFLNTLVLGYFFKEEYNLALEISYKCIEIDYNYYESLLTKAKIFLKLENKSKNIIN